MVVLPYRLGVGDVDTEQAIEVDRGGHVGDHDVDLIEHGLRVTQGETYESSVAIRSPTVWLLSSGWRSGSDVSRE